MEFTDSATARIYADVAEGTYLGGPFALLRASKAELERYPILSLTENSSMEGSSVSQPSDEKASEQYILTHKSWYAQDAWVALENFLTSQTTPLTPTDCATVRVAVIDSGIDATHEDLAGRVTAGWDAVNHTAIGAGVNSDVSSDSHGTKVAGLIGAASDNGVGMVGAAWTFPVELIPVRVLNSRNKGTVADVVAAIYWAVDEGNADILNMSFGQTLRSVPSAMQTAVLHAVEKGVIVVAAAGNDGEYYKSADYSYYPAVLDGVLPVGSTAKALGSSYGNYNNYVQRAEFSNQPSYESDCGKTFFYTPGEDLLTTSAGNSYEEFSGTSASAALLSGMLAALKSCADTTGRPSVENYLSYNKYSYLGGLYYQEYKTMADALVAGYTSGDVRFTFDAHLPHTLRGTVVLSGILNDPACRYQSVSLFFDGKLVGTIARTNGAKQYLSFTVDTTAFEDDYYYPSRITLMGMLEDGTEEEIEHSRGFDIANNSECCIVKITSGGAPLVGAKGWLFRSGKSEPYWTNGLGEIELPVSAADGQSSLLAVGEELLVWRKLAPYPAGNRYAFGNDPALLTIRCSGDILAVADGAAIYAAMPDGKQYEVGIVAGGETRLWVDADSPMTFTVCGTGILLSETIDLSGDDVVWDLDSAETASLTLTHDEKAPTEGTEGTVRRIGLEIAGFVEQLLDAEGGTMLVTPGEYSVTGYVYWCDGNYYSNYAKVELGMQSVTGEGLTLTLGSGAPVASVAVDSETVTEGQSVSVTLSFTDSNGNAIAELGSSDAECSYREKYRYNYLSIEEYDAESETWNQINQINLNQIPGSVTASGGLLGTQPGLRRIVFHGEGFISNVAVADATAEFVLVPQETRPAATVRIALLDSYGYNVYGVSAATVLKDAEGNDIVREAYTSESRDEAIIKLPIGNSYTLTVLALDYSTAYLTTCTVDLTGAADGDEVSVSTTADDSWVSHQIPWSSEDGSYFNVRNLALTPFADFPAYKLTGAGTNGHIETLYASGFAQADLYLDVMPDSYDEVENYEYPPVFTMKMKVDLSEASTLQVGIPKTITLTVETDADSAVLTPVITDAYGHEVTGATYTSRYGDMEGGGDMVEGDMPVVKPTMVYPVITIYDSDGDAVFTKNTAFLPVTAEGLGEGVYAATIVWKSSDIDLTGEQINFTIGAGGEEPPVIPMLQVPTAFRAAVVDGAVNLNWAAPVNGCAGYLLLRDGETLAELNGDAISYVDNDVVGGSYYMYTLYAIDEQGRKSEAVTVGVGISAGADVTAPAWGNSAELIAEVGDGGVNLSWNRAQDADSGVTSYLLFCNGEEIAQLFTRKYTYSAVQPNVDYVFSVKAVDGAGNVSEALTADAVSISSGILGAQLDYASNRLGYMTGTIMSVRVQTTADLDSVSIVVNYTDSDGVTDTLTLDVTGVGGSFATNVALPDDFKQVDQITVTSGSDEYVCLDAPILRCSSHVEVTVDLADAAALYPTAVLTLYAPSVGYAYSYPISNMVGTVAEDVIADDAYQLTLADSNGNVLLVRQVDLSADAHITLDAEDTHFLQLTVEGGYAGLAVTVAFDGKIVSGKLDESGTAVWSSGGRFLPVGSSATVSIPELRYSEEITFDKVVNQKTIQPEALGYEVVTIPVTVVDTDGKGISGIEVRIAGYHYSEMKITGADGTCVFTFVNRKDNVPMISMQQQRDDQNRIWTYLSYSVFGSSAVLEPTQMYDQILVRPVLNMGVDTDVNLEDFTYTINGQPVQLKDGLLSLTATETYWRRNQLFTVTAKGTVDGEVCSGKANGWLDPDHPGQSVEIDLKENVNVTLTLTDNGDVVKGIARYLAVYDAQDNLVTSLKTYDAAVTVALVDGEKYYAAGSWDPIPQRWQSDPCVARASITAREGLQVTLSGTRSDIASLLLTDYKILVNGIERHMVSEDADGNILVTLRINNSSVPQRPNLSKVYNELVLPAGVQSVNYDGGDFTYDPDTGIVRILTDLSELAINRRHNLYVTFAADQLESDAQILHDLVFTYSENEYRTRGDQLVLDDILMVVSVPERISRTALSSSGVTARVQLPCAQAGILELYDGDALLASCATKAQQKTYQLQIDLPAILGKRSIRVVYTGDDGVQLTQTVIIEIVDDARPLLLSAKYSIYEDYQGDLMDGQGELYYFVGRDPQVTCLATFSNPEMVDQVWLCGETDSKFDRIELRWDPAQNAFYGAGQLSELCDPFTALWIEFSEILPGVEDLGNVVQGEFSVDYELTYTPKENPNNPYSYAPDPDLGEAVQAQALSDWEKYVYLVNGGLYEMEEEDAIAALNELFGEDGVWNLPAVTDGEHHFSMNYGYDPDTVARKLASDEAFTVIINGEKRKVLIEFEEENGDLYICYYGLGDLFIPAVAETGEPEMAAAGSLLAGVRDFIKRHWEDGMAVKEKYDEYEWLREGLKEEFSKDPEGEEPGANDSGDPCGSGNGTGKQTREQRRQQIDEMFDEGWEAAKAVSEGISMAGGAMGMEASVLGEFITQDGGVTHSLFEMQKQRLHQIDDILDEADEDAFADEPEDPCDPEEKPEKGKEPEKDREHPKLGYQPIWPLMDPSGYLYAGAPAYPVEGVKAYLYYLDEDGETWTLWNSGDFGQGPNPYPSDANGYYGWDVLPGKWKVVFEGEGYARAESIVLDVPPPHMDVDIAMTSTRNPQISDVIVKADGSIFIKFDHPMTTESVLNNAVTVTLGSERLTGTLGAVNPTVTALGIKQAALSTNIQPGLKVASVFRFVPDDTIVAGMTVEVTVDASVLGYNGLPMLSGWSDRLTVPEQDDAMTLVSVERIREDGIYLNIGNSYTLSGDDWYAVFSDGFGAEEKRTDIAIHWYSNDESVATVDETGKITAVGGGIASIIGEYDGHTIVFGVSVTRAPILADAAENDVKFCRDLNLVLGKACYMWSSAANFRLDDPMEGDEKYMPTAWRIKEAGVVMAEGTVADGESSLKIIYTPTVLGTLIGEIDYQKYVYTGGRWVASGSSVTATRNIPVTEVTGLTLHTAPEVVKPGEALDLSTMRIGIALSDGSVSTVGYEKLASYGITMNLNHGDILDESDTVLILTHARTGITLMIELQSGDADRVHICRDHLTPVVESGATCTEDGYKAHYKCSCGKYFEDASASIEIPDIDAWKNGDGKISAGHTYGDLVEAQEAIHTKDLLKGAVAAHYQCSVCEKYFTENYVDTTLLALTGEVPTHTHSEYDISADTHQSICSCGAPVDSAETHDYTTGASDRTCVCGAKFTGWEGKTYYVDAVMQTGWTQIGSDWYYFDTTTGVRAEGMTRVPYPEVAINGVTYAPNAEDVAYAESKGRTFIDKEEAWFVFGEDGKFDATTEIVDGKYVANGMIAWHPGFVTVNNELYYFVG
ncbi:MAG: S8 family serine peptidase, partial [Clostridia bacterium]|nr:S8 family serine peptidase [Clostridia bacterium]